MPRRRPNVQTLPAAINAFLAQSENAGPIVTPQQLAEMQASAGVATVTRELERTFDPRPSPFREPEPSAEPANEPASVVVIAPSLVSPESEVPRSRSYDSPAYFHDAEPEIGMGVTVLGWGGRFAGTIVRMNRPKTKIVVKRDRVLLHVGRMQDGFRYEPDPDGFETAFTKRRNGAWIREKTYFGAGVTELWIGTRSEISTIIIEGV